MIEKINQLLESNDIMCRIGSEWYKLEEIGPVYEDNELEITMTDDDGVETGALLSDIEEFDTHDVFGEPTNLVSSPLFEQFNNHIGIA